MTEPREPAARPGTTLAAVFELLRPPNVFTAVADSLAGLALVRAGAFSPADPGLWCLAASACLYLGGMALNDYFDREVDARERPERPIPSGRVPASLAGWIGGALLALGVLFAGLAGPGPFGLAIVLAAAILAYDAFLKGTWAGFLNMGLNRALNFSMPLALAAPGELAPAVWAAPVVLGAYVCVVTFLSTGEVAGSDPARARTGVVGMAIVAACLAAVLAVWEAPLVGWIFFAALLGRGAEVFGPLLRDASGPTIGRSIGGGILTIPLLDATLVAGAGHLYWAAAVVLLAVPAMALRRFYSPT